MIYVFLLVGLQVCVGRGVYSLPPAVSTSEAHGPLARLALGSARITRYYSAPASVVVPENKPYPEYPGYLARPGYVRKIVDVPTAKVATAKLKVRRPAVQKQFYDIEHRTIVRPVGSAVVELQEPISKSYVSHSPVVQYPAQFLYPVGPYPFRPYTPFQGPVPAYPLTFIQQPTLIPQIPQYPQQVQPRPPTQPPVVVRPPQNIPAIPQPRPDDDSEISDFDSSDTVVIENPDFDRSLTRPRASPKGEKVSIASSKTEGNGVQDRINDQQTVYTNGDQINVEYQANTEQILNEFLNRQLLRMLMRQHPVGPLERFQLTLPLNPNEQIPQQNTVKLVNAKLFQRSQGVSSLEPIDYVPTTTSTEPTSTTDITVGEETEVKEDHATDRTSTTYSVNTPTSTDSQDTEQRIQVRQDSSEQIPSVRFSSSVEAQVSQQELTGLLTGQGDMSESKTVGKLTGVGDAGLLSGRVLSVTAAPLDGHHHDEKVSTRRVLVSRPIETIEEVDVHQPFTDVESVLVHERALLKSPTHDARLPSALPVLGPTPTAVLYN